MKNVEIGLVTIDYNTEGDIIHYSFKPTLELKPEKRVFDQLRHMIPSDDANLIKENADMILAAWFSRITDIELAERDRYDVRSEVVNCERYENGRVKQCVIRYLFVELFQ